MSNRKCTAVIVQARIASTRFPGKVLSRLSDHSVIEHVLHRCKAIPGADAVVCAIPDTGENDELAAEAARCDVVVTRGPEADVLERYRQAAAQVDAGIIMRVTSDCPFVDPAVCGATLRLRAETDAEYACNNMPPSWPHGLDCEAFTMDILTRCAAEATQPAHREHVTPWMRTNPAVRRVNLSQPGSRAVEQRWTVDYPEDLEFLRAVAASLPVWPAISSQQAILDLLEKNPGLSSINANRRDLGRIVRAGGA